MTMGAVVFGRQVVAAEVAMAVFDTGTVAVVFGRGVVFGTGTVAVFGFAAVEVERAGVVIAPSSTGDSFSNFHFLRVVGVLIALAVADNGGGGGVVADDVGGGDVVDVTGVDDDGSGDVGVVVSAVGVGGGVVIGPNNPSFIELPLTLAIALTLSLALVPALAIALLATAPALTLTLAMALAPALAILTKGLRIDTKGPISAGDGVDASFSARSSCIDFPVKGAREIPGGMTV